MSAVVLDINIFQMPAIVDGLEGYTQAFILIRTGKRPVGHLWVTVEDGHISRPVILEHIKHTWGHRLWRQIVVDRYLQWDEVELPSKLPTATVAVITRDRPGELRRCLDALMALPDDGQEYLVIDNCPNTDETKCLVSTYDRARYIREDRPGASAARNRALLEANNEIVALTDDDAYPDPGWLRALLRNFGDPLVLCVTGLVLPFELETDAQRWFETYSPHGRGYTRHVYDGFYGDALAVHPIGVSASMALRRNILEEVGAFEEALSAGLPTHGGEDNELFSRILRSGYRIVYDPLATSRHRHRRTWPELRQTLFGYGVGVYAYWTHALVVEHELRVMWLAWAWLFYVQMPNLIRSLLRRPNCVPLDLLIVELLGCAVGPLAYIRSRRLVAKHKRVPS